jgi:hypothetical protein
LQRGGDWRRLCENHIGFQGDQFFSKRLMTVPAAACEASVDAHIAALRPSEPLEPLPEARQARLHVWIVFAEGC